MSSPFSVSLLFFAFLFMVWLIRRWVKSWKSTLILALIMAPTITALLLMMLLSHAM